MAREHARILTRIWDDEDFCSLPADEQRMYMLLLSRRNVSQCGVLPLQVRKWAKGSATTSEEDIERALKGLETKRYVAVDHDTEEVLVRSFVRNDGVLKVPNVFKAALRAATGIESPKLRKMLALELRKVGRSDADTVAWELFPTESERDPDDVRTESGTVDNHPEPVDNLTVPDVIRTESERVAGVGVGEGGKEPSVGGSVGEAPRISTEQKHDAREPPADRCTKHRNDPAPPPCRGCASAREARERWDADESVRAEAIGRDIERARRDHRQRCEHDTDGGLFIHPITGVSATCAFCRRTQREAS